MNAKRSLTVVGFLIVFTLSGSLLITIPSFIQTVSFIQVANAIEQSTKDCSSIPQISYFDPTYIKFPANTSITAFSVGKFRANETTVELQKLVLVAHYDHSDTIRNLTTKHHVDFSISLDRFHLHHNLTKISVAISHFSLNLTDFGKTYYQNGTLKSISPINLSFELPSLMTQLSCS